MTETFPIPCPEVGCEFNVQPFPYVKHFDDGSHAAVSLTVSGGGRVQLYKPGEIWGAWAEFDYAKSGGAAWEVMESDGTEASFTGWVRKRVLDAEGRSMETRQ